MILADFQICISVPLIVLKEVKKYLQYRESRITDKSKKKNWHCFIEITYYKEKQHQKRSWFDESSCKICKNNWYCKSKRIMCENPLFCKK